MALLGGLACASEGHSPPRSMEPLWSRYRELPPQRALAIAGDPLHGRWVAGMSGGQATSREAAAAALEECGVRRLQRRLREDCTLYAQGDEVVWRGR